MPKSSTPLSTIFLLPTLGPALVGAMYKSPVNGTVDPAVKGRKGPPIIGTTGLSSSQINDLSIFAQKAEVGCAIIPNFSVGAAYQKLFSIALSENFNSIGIIEKHHSNKQDAPSGTASDLAESLSTELLPIEQDGKFFDVNNINNKNIYSLRGDQYLAEQVVNFVNDYESFHLEHKVDDRRAYLYGMKIVLDQFNQLEGFNLGLENIIADKIKI